jgi:hypothetical protein
MVIWQCEKYDVTAKEAIEQFCRSYWAQPRRHHKIQPDGTFKMVGGLATYRCVVHGTDQFGRWHIEKIGGES